MRASPLRRLWAIPVIWLPALTALWIFVSTRDWEHGWRQFQLGHHVNFPPRAKSGPRPEAIQTAQHVATATVHIVELAAFAVAAIALTGKDHARRQNGALVE